MEKLTKEQAIEEHRKMWLWITRNCIELLNKDYSIRDIKKMYIKEHTPYDIYSIKQDCFCCEYNWNRENDGIRKTYGLCAKCPIEWSGECNTCCNKNGEYGVLTDIESDYYWYTKQRKNKKMKNHMERRIVKLAYKIATLPERNDNV